MMRSLFSGVAGLKTHQTKMDVIGNNVANVNTTAYKSMSITFSELMYQTTSKASGPNSLTGTAGINPKQIGLGVTSAAISTAITNAGSAQTTSDPFDIRINGDAFFVVSDGSNNYFTRDGSFFVDAAGNLAMTSNGYNVMGWQVDPETGLIKQDTVTALRIMSAENMSYEAEATSAATIGGIVDKLDTQINSTAGKVMNLGFFDNLGYSYTAKLSMHATANEGEFYIQLDDILDANGKSITERYGVDLATICQLGAATTVEIEENYNPITNSFTYTDPGTGESHTYTQSATYDEATQSYIFSFKDENGSIVQAGDSPSPDELAADQGLDLGSFTNNGDGTYSVDATTVNGWLASNDDIKTNIQALHALFGDSVTESMNLGTVDDVTGTITITSKNIQGGLVKYNTDNGAFVSVNGDPTGLTLNFADSFNDNGTTVSLGNFSDIKIDMTSSKTGNNGGASTLSAVKGDLSGQGTGRKMGQMSGISISANGEIWAAYDNGMSRLLGQIAVAEFSNASGLEKVGENLYAATLNSGEFNGIGVDISASGGSMATGELEMSNVDLAQEFTDMITTQRGYQANSRTISVSDSLLEELVNLKR